MLALFSEWNAFQWHRNGCIITDYCGHFAVRCYWIKIIPIKNVYNMNITHTHSLWMPSNTVHVKPFDCSHGHSKDLFILFSGFVCFFISVFVCELTAYTESIATSNHFYSQKEIRQLKRIQEIYVSIFLSLVPPIWVHPFARHSFIRFIPTAC